MKKSLILSLLLSVVLVAAAQAQATRTWVSGVGDDVNPCSRTAPCKTFAGAISKTAVGGEIDTLDPGGFGAVTITKAITLDGTQNGLAGGSILVAGTAAIVVSAPTNAVVTIRGLSLNGAGSGTVGINVIQAQAVHVEGCVIFEFNGRGISVANTSGNVNLFVRHTIIRNNATDGITSIPAGGTATVVIENSQIDQNTQQGFQANNNTKAGINNSSFSGNGNGILVTQTNNSVDIESSTMTLNGTGLLNGFGGGAPTTRISRCLIANNTTAGITVNGGSVIGFQNNTVADNPVGNSVSMSVAQQ